MTTHAESRNTGRATEQMQPHLDRTARERAEIDRQIKDLNRATQRS
jgi:hypothetical protein